VCELHETVQSVGPPLSRLVYHPSGGYDNKWSVSKSSSTGCKVSLEVKHRLCRFEQVYSC
jgi:hypothetical protein